MKNDLLVESTHFKLKYKKGLQRDPKKRGDSTIGWIQSGMGLGVSFAFGNESSHTRLLPICISRVDESHFCSFVQVGRIQAVE